MLLPTTLCALLSISYTFASVAVQNTDLDFYANRPVALVFSKGLDDRLSSSIEHAYCIVSLVINFIQRHTFRL